MATTTTTELLISKLKAWKILPSGTPVALVRGKDKWHAVHSVSKVPLGVWSDISMTELVLPGELQLSPEGKITRIPLVK